MKTLLTSLLVILVLVWCGCDEGNPVTDTDPPVPPDPPVGLFGVPAQQGEDVNMLLMWIAPDTGTIPTGYDVYRSLNKTSFVKINQTAITEASFGPAGQDYPEALFYSDTSYDTTSVEIHNYFVVAVVGDDVSEPSDTVSCIPATISRDNRVANITPADSAVGVDLMPVMGWDTMDSAGSYFVFLMEADEYYPLWMQRCYDVTCDLGVISATTYLVGMEDSLQSIHDYEWIVWAISGDNCGFALTEGTFTTTYSEIVSTIENNTYPPGHFTICWDQSDELDNQVPQGFYAFHIVAGSFDEIGHAFEIADHAEHVGSICDTPVTVPSIPYMYQTGDLIPITFSLPEEATVRVDLVR